MDLARSKKFSTLRSQRSTVPNLPQMVRKLCRPTEMNFFEKIHRNEALLWIHVQFHHSQNVLAQPSYQREALELAIQYSQARSSNRKGIQTFNPVQFKHYDFMLKGLLCTDAHPFVTPNVLKRVSIENVMDYLPRNIHTYTEY